MFTIPCTVVCASTVFCVHACRHAVRVCTKPSVCSLRCGCMLGDWVCGCVGVCGGKGVRVGAREM